MVVVTQTRNYFKSVSENKEITKIISLLSTAINSTKKEVTTDEYNKSVRSKMRLIGHFGTIRKTFWRDRRKDRRTDIPSCRDPWTHLKTPVNVSFAKPSYRTLLSQNEVELIIWVIDYNRPFQISRPGGAFQQFWKQSVQRLKQLRNSDRPR